MRIAISGLGSIGFQHLAAAARRGDTAVSVFDPAPDLRHRAATVACVDRVHAEVDGLLDDRPDALMVASPDFAHLDQLLAANAHGVPVLVEKPLAPSLADALTAERRLDRSVPVLVGYVLRHRPAMRRVTQLLRDGAVGVPVTAQVALGAYQTLVVAASRFGTPERDRLYRDYSHEWDYLRWWFGPVGRAFAVAGTFADVPHVEVPNTVDGLLDFRCGMRAAFHIDYVDPVGMRQVTVLGNRGHLRVDVPTGHVAWQSTGADARTEDHPCTAAEGLDAQLDHLVAVARGAADPLVGWDDGVSALAVTHAIIESARTETWAAVPAAGSERRPTAVNDQTGTGDEAGGRPAQP